MVDLIWKRRVLLFLGAMFLLLGCLLTFLPLLTCLTCLEDEEVVVDLMVVPWLTDQLIHWVYLLLSHLAQMRESFSWCFSLLVERQSLLALLKYWFLFRIL